MSQQLTEDDLYRTSTQYRLWSFSSDELASLRSTTHSAAVERARHYPKDGVNGDSNGDTHMTDGVDNPQCLTLEEEIRLVQRYCEQVRTTCDFFKWSVQVKATAVQYLKRFYLTNSCMTYPPKEIYKSVLFLASKTEGTHMTLGEYARRIKTAPEDILAPEYKIIQALRFTLDVRQPFRGLRGCLMELLNIAEGHGSSGPSSTKSAAELQGEMASLPTPSSSSASSRPADIPQSYRTTWTSGMSLADRANAAQAAARQTLDAPALLTDVYFLFTPPQIYLAALHLADAPLADFYLQTKLGSSQDNQATLSAVQNVIAECADMLVAYGREPVMTKEERARLEEKLEGCRDPGTKDMVAMNAKAKRDGKREDEVDEDKAKRRQAERDKAAGDDVFGPAIGK